MNPSKSILPAIALIALSLAACEAERTPDGTAAANAAPSDQPAKNVPPATAPDSVNPPEPPIDGPAQVPGVGMERMDGFGDMRFGMSEAEAKQAWGGDLNGLADASQDCHYVTPTYNKTPRDLAFMVEGGKFVRYDVALPNMIAPGGGKVGMTAEQIESRYGAQLKQTPDKYVEGGKNLSVGDAAGGPGKLVFVTDAAGKVTAWHAGVPPQVDYVEGCS